MSALATRWFALGRAAALIRAQPGSFLLNVGLSALALVVPLFLTMLGFAVAPWAAHLGAGPEVNVFVSPGARPGDVEALRARLAALPDVSDVRLIPREEAYADLAKRAGLPSGGSSRPNPLPDVLVARYAGTVESNAVERSATVIRAWPLVDSVRLDIEWHRRASAVMRAVGLILIIVAGLSLVLVALALVAATRVQAESRRAESTVLILAGARPSFIVRPYAYAGALTLGLGTALAIGLATGAMALVEFRIAAVAAAFGHEFRLTPPPLWAPPALLGLVAVGGYLAASIGARSAVVRARRM